MSVHHRRSQIATVMTTTITADSLPPKPKLDCYGGYDMVVKGASVVVIGTKWVFRNKQDQDGIVVRNKVRLVA